MFGIVVLVAHVFKNQGFVLFWVGLVYLLSSGVWDFSGNYLGEENGVSSHQLHEFSLANITAFTFTFTFTFIVFVFVFVFVMIVVAESNCKCRRVTRRHLPRSVRFTTCSRGRVARGSN